MANKTVHTVRIETAPGERAIYAAAEAARIAGATHYAIMAPHPSGGYYRAAVGLAAKPMRTREEAEAISSGEGW